MSLREMFTRTPPSDAVDRQKLLDQIAREADDRDVELRRELRKRLGMDDEELKPDQQIPSREYVWRNIPLALIVIGLLLMLVVKAIAALE